MRISVPAIVREHLLKHIQRFEIEIVGRLVEHGKLDDLRERPGEHQARGLAARAPYPASASAPAGTGSPARRSRRAWPHAVDLRQHRLSRRSALPATVHSGFEAVAVLLQADPPRFAPNRTGPVAGASLPVSIFTSVVLPVPFGPAMPAVAAINAGPESIRDGLAAERFEIPFASITSLPDSRPLRRLQLHLPRGALRVLFASRMACSSPSRRTSRFRRAVTP